MAFLRREGDTWEGTKLQKSLKKCPLKNDVERDCVEKRGTFLLPSLRRGEGTGGEELQEWGSC